MKTSHIESITAEGEISRLVFEDEIRYCWVDENGKRVSPIHTSFGPALTYINDWNKRAAAIERRAVEAQREWDMAKSQDPQPVAWRLEKFEREVERVNTIKNKLTLTGRAPIRLVRVVTRMTVEPLTEAEEPAVVAVYDLEFA